MLIVGRRGYWLAAGPGGFIATFGLAIVAMEFRGMAALLDRTERAGRNLWARLRGQKAQVPREAP